MHTSITLFASHMINQHPSRLTLITKLTHHTLNTRTITRSTITRKPTSIRHLNPGSLTLTLRTTRNSKIPMIRQTLITLFPAHTRLTLTLSRPHITLTRRWTQRITRTSMTTLAFIKTPHTIPTLSTIITLYIWMTRTIACLSITLGRTTLITITFLAIFSH